MVELAATGEQVRQRLAAAGPLEAILGAHGFPGQIEARLAERLALARECLLAHQQRPPCHKPLLM